MPLRPPRLRVALLLLALLLAGLSPAAAAPVPTPAAAVQSPTPSAALDQALAAAQQAQAAGNYRQAATAYASATALDPSLAELWANRGLMEHLASEPQAAIASFHRALALKPHLFTPVLFIGLDTLALHQPQAAIPWLDRALHQQPANPDALLALGQAFSETGRLEDAADTLQHLAQVAPSNSQAWFSLAAARLALIDRDGARLTSTAPYSVWAQALYARDLLLQGRPREASTTLATAAGSATPAERSTLLAVLDAPRSRAELLGTPALSPEVLDAALAPLRSGSPATAASACSPHATASPVCSFLAGDVLGTANAAGAQLRRSPDAAEALFWSIRSNEQLATEALSTFEQLAPGTPATFDLAGDLLRHRAEPDRALAAYKQALALDPHDPVALLGSSAAYLDINQPAPALEAARAGLAADPASPRLNLAAAEALLLQHQPADARPFAQAALQSATHDPSSVPSLVQSAHGLLGRIESEQGDLPAAIADLTLALPADANGTLSFQLARLYRRQGNTAQAQHYEQQARSLIDARRARASTAVAEAAAATTP